MVINIGVQYRWASPRHYTVDPRLLPSGNPFICHIVALSLKPICNSILLLPFMIYYIVSVLFLMSV